MRSLLKALKEVKVIMERIRTTDTKLGINYPTLFWYNKLYTADQLIEEHCIITDLVYNVNKTVLSSFKITLPALREKTIRILTPVSPSFFVWTLAALHYTFNNWYKISSVLITFSWKQDIFHRFYYREIICRALSGYDIPKATIRQNGVIVVMPLLKACAETLLLLL